MEWRISLDLAQKWNPLSFNFKSLIKKTVWGPVCTICVVYLLVNVPVFLSSYLKSCSAQQIFAPTHGCLCVFVCVCVSPCIFFNYYFPTTICSKVSRFRQLFPFGVWNRNVCGHLHSHLFALFIPFYSSSSITALHDLPEHSVSTYSHQFASSTKLTGIFAAAVAVVVRK